MGLGFCLTGEIAVTKPTGSEPTLFGRKLFASPLFPSKSRNRRFESHNNYSCHVWALCFPSLLAFYTEVGVVWAASGWDFPKPSCNTFCSYCHVCMARTAAALLSFWHFSRKALPAQLLAQRAPSTTTATRPSAAPQAEK